MKNIRLLAYYDADEGTLHMLDDGESFTSGILRYGRGSYLRDEDDRQYFDAHGDAVDLPMMEVEGACLSRAGFSMPCRSFDTRMDAAAVARFVARQIVPGRAFRVYRTRGGFDRAVARYEALHGAGEADCYIAG